MKKPICSGEPDLPANDQSVGLLQEEASFVVHGQEVHPAQRGYTAVYNYALYFWRPYLGNTAFSLWELLLSFCYGDSDTVFPSISRLARMLSNSDESRRVVTGRKKTFGVSEQTPKVSGSDGALKVLLRERLVQVNREGEGHLSRYTFRVCKALPLLRPAQVARLCPALQRDHAQWLRRYGIDPSTYREAFAAPHQAEPPTPDPTQHAEGRRPVAPGPTPAVPGTGGEVPRPTPAAADTGGEAPRPTNNPQGASLLNHWWKEAITELSYGLRRGTFDMCLRHTRVQSFADGVLTLQAPTPMVLDLLQHRLASLLQRTLRDTSQGRVQQIVFE